jgi:EAL domain-containing protein (putative c-di-GMP-specific phosphodiesterase class I)
MSHREFHPFAQPVVDVATGEVRGYRGVVRWQHPTRGLLAAGEFVHLVAETPIATVLDLYVARQVAALIERVADGRDLRVYAPVSMPLLVHPRAEYYLEEIGDAFGLSLAAFHLQIARSLLDEPTPRLTGALRALRDAGIALVLTDAGHPTDPEKFAAYGFAEVHASRALAHTPAHPSGRDALAELVECAHQLGMMVAATGVVDAQHRERVLHAGCDLATGLYYGEPTSARE